MTERQGGLDTGSPASTPPADESVTYLNAAPSANYRPGQRGGFRERKSVAHSLRSGIPSMLRSVSRRPDFDLPDLASLAALEEHLERALDTAVANLRAQGHSWQAIADELGTTRQAAHQRFR